MKKVSHRVERTGDSVAVMANWRSRMRTPTKVEIHNDNLTNPAETTLVEGGAAEVFDTLSGIAEIAWEMGWRPHGLEQVVAAVVKSYKIPAG